MKPFILIFAVMVGEFVAGAQAQVVEIRIPMKTTYDTTQEYPLALLRFVMDKSGVPYSITMTDIGVTTQAREILLIRANSAINLSWFGTSAALERDLVPVRYPMWRGLLGYRVFLIHKNAQPRFDRVNTLDDLRQFTGEQGLGWSDIPILEAAGLKQNASTYDAIFPKINAGRADYFARGVVEAFRELKARQAEFPNLVVERHVLLVYRFAGFFFTNKEHPEIRDALVSGFQKAYADGSFERFFYRQDAVRSALDQANLKDRVRIEIPNPDLTPETLGIPDVYWDHSR